MSDIQDAARWRAVKAAFEKDGDGCLLVETFANDLVLNIFGDYRYPDGDARNSLSVRAENLDAAADALIARQETTE